MLAKRIIPCLDVRDGAVVKGVGFRNLRNAGDPVHLGCRYARMGADELVYLDVIATVTHKKVKNRLVASLGRSLDIPFTVGGGIRNRKDVRALLLAGADKVSVNSAAVTNPMLINKLALEFGSQCLVVAIDARWAGGWWEVMINGGRGSTGREVLDWAGEANDRGAGEILLTVMDRDGSGKGFHLDLTRSVVQGVSCPVIASGGGGERRHFYDVFSRTGAAAALAAGMFHFNRETIPNLKKYLSRCGIPVRIPSGNYPMNSVGTGG
jgi:cyclase